MDPRTILKEALAEPEHDWLDFKYDLDIKSAEEQGELIKDLSALANTVDRVGYLILGVKFIPGKPFQFKNFDKGYDDNDFQQLVKGKLNRPIHFEYYPPFECEEGKKQAFFKVFYSDAKPHQVKHNLGRIHEGQVFIRRGTRTEPASVEEIIEMSLNAVNDLSKIEEADLASRIVVLLRRGDHVGIREILRHAHRPAQLIFNYIHSQPSPHQALMDNIESLDSVLLSISRRVATIGIALIRHNCTECYNDLLGALAKLYFLTHDKPALKTRAAAFATWGHVLVLGGFSLAVRNWDFAIALLRYRMWTRDERREYLFLHFLNPEKGGFFHPEFERLYLAPLFIDDFDCDLDQYMIHLSEFDILAHVRSKRIEGTYAPSWQKFKGEWRDILFEDLISNQLAREFFVVLSGSAGIRDLRQLMDIS